MASGRVSKGIYRRFPIVNNAQRRAKLLPESPAVPPATGRVYGPAAQMV